MKYTMINFKITILPLFALLLLTSCSNIEYQAVQTESLMISKPKFNKIIILPFTPPKSAPKKAYHFGYLTRDTGGAAILTNQITKYLKQNSQIAFEAVPEVLKDNSIEELKEIAIKYDATGVIQGEVYAYDTYRRGAEMTAELNVSIRLVDVESSKIVWTGIIKDGYIYSHNREWTPIYDTANRNVKKIASSVLNSIEYSVTPSKEIAKSTSGVKVKNSLHVRSEFQNSWAVVVGISQYQYPKYGLSNLIFADDDAKAFSSFLQQIGWSQSHIKLLTNSQATHRNIMIALRSWLTKAGPNDQVILFWAGHGYPDPEDPEKVYFATYDTDISIPATGYRMDEVNDALREVGNKNVIILADTCHAGKLITRGSRGISIVPKINKMKEQQEIPKGWIFMVGADSDRQAIEDSSWSNGAFTHCLIRGLRGEADGFQSAGVNDGIVTMGELRTYMNIVMPNETQKVLGVAKRPVITTSSGDPTIWNLTLQQLD